MEAGPKVLLAGAVGVGALGLLGHVLIDWEHLGMSGGHTVLPLRHPFVWIADSYADLDSRADQLLTTTKFDSTCLRMHLDALEHIKNETLAISRALPSMGPEDQVEYRARINGLLQEAEMHIRKAGQIMDAIESKRPISGSCI